MEAAVKGQEVELKRQTEGGGGERRDKTQNSHGRDERWKASYRYPTRVYF